MYTCPGILFQVSCTACSKLLGVKSVRFLSSCVAHDHKLSIQLRSGDLAGHSISVKLWLASQALVLLAVWALALSYSKIHCDPYRLPMITLHAGIRLSSRSCVYTLAVTPFVSHLRPVVPTVVNNGVLPHLLTPP